MNTKERFEIIPAPEQKGQDGIHQGSGSIP